jgi:hypothetical protein
MVLLHPAAPDLLKYADVLRQRADNPSSYFTSPAFMNAIAALPPPPPGWEGPVLQLALGLHFGLY